MDHDDLSPTLHEALSDGTLEFLDIASYYPYDTRAEVPESWKPYVHPNGDVYYFNSGMRLLSTDDIRDPSIRANVVEIRNDYYEALVEDPDFAKLPSDWVMTITDTADCAGAGAGAAGDSVAVVGIHSRTAGKSYEWSEEEGLVEQPREQFWAHFAEYPSHDKSIPQTIEGEFLRALCTAEEKSKEGVEFPLDRAQIEQVIRRYNYLKAYQMQGKAAATPNIAWLMGAVMPLDALKDGSSRVTDDVLNALMNNIHF